MKTKCGHGNFSDECVPCEEYYRGYDMKTKTQHTPGPWEFRVHTGWLISINTPGDGNGFPGLYLGEIKGDSSRHDEEIANARLIASAPELLEVCKMALNSPIDGSYIAAAKWFGIMKEIVAKAEGGAK